MANQRAKSDDTDIVIHNGRKMIAAVVATTSGWGQHNMGTTLKGPSIRKAEKHCPGALVGTFIAKLWNGVRQGKLGLEIKSQTKPLQNEQPKKRMSQTEKLYICAEV